jgi:hypothetical protein
MILNNAVNTGNFIYCVAHITPNEQHSYYNQGHGHYHQYAYIVDGYAVSHIRDNKDSEPLHTFQDDARTQGILLDLSFTLGKYHTITTNDHGISMILFNPIPETRNLNVEIITGPIAKTVLAVDKRIVLVSITGPIYANEKPLVSLQHAKIFPGKTVELTVPENAICALVSDN